MRKLISDGYILSTYEESVNPASINLRLGNTFKTIDSDQGMILLGHKVIYRDVIPNPANGSVIIHPGEFMLATTKEWVHVPTNAAAFVQGRSSIGRAALSVQNAGFVDPGFHGHITLELKNDGPVPIVLYPGYPVTQLVYMDAEDVEEGYHGKYSGQTEATGSRMDLDVNVPGNQTEING